MRCLVLWTAPSCLILVEVSGCFHKTMGTPSQDYSVTQLVMRETFGMTSFRTGHLETIRKVLSVEQGVISVMATGSGKVTTIRDTLHELDRRM